MPASCLDCQTTLSKYVLMKQTHAKALVRCLCVVLSFRSSRWYVFSLLYTVYIENALNLFSMYTVESHYSDSDRTCYHYKRVYYYNKV